MTRLILVLAALAAASLAAIWVLLRTMSDRWPEPLPAVDGDFGEAGW